MQKYVAIFLWVFLCQTKANAQYDFLLNKSYGERVKSIDSLLFSPTLWKQDSTTYFAMLDDIAAQAKDASDDELYWQTEISRIEFYTYNWLYTYKQSVEKLQELLPEIKQHPKLVLQISYISGLHYYHNDEFVKAFEYLIKYKHLLDDFTNEEYPKRKVHYSTLGDLSYAFEDYESAKKYLSKAAEIPTTHAKQIDNGLYNTLGLTMRNTGKYDSALYYFNKVLSMTISEQDPWVAISNGNIGVVYYLMGRYNEAKPLLREDINRALAAHEYDNISNQLIKLADINRIQGQYDSARYYGKLARQYTPIGRDTYKHLVSLYAVLSKIAEHDGAHTLALKYADSVALAKDSVSDRRSVLNMGRAQIKVQEERHKVEVAKIVTEKELSIQKRNNLIAILSLSTIIGFLFINQQNIKRKRLKAEKELADNKLVNAQQRLDNFTQSLQDKNKLIERFSEEIERLQALPCSNELPDTKENLAKLQNSIILTESQWNDFRELFEEVHTGFLLRLREKLPDLTPAETRFMALCKLKLSNKEMAGMLGIGASGMRNYKYRLRKKLNISSDDEMIAMVDNI